MAKRWVLLPLAYLVLGIIGIFVLIALLLQVPYVQTKVVSFASKKVTTLLDHRLEIGHVSISWFDEAVIEGIKLYDKDERLMMQVNYLKTDLNIFDLFSSPSSMSFDHVELREGEFHLLTAKEDSVFNINQFIDAISDLSAPDTASSNSEFELSIYDITLLDGVFEYGDFTKEPIKKGFNYNQFTLNDIQAQVDGLWVKANGSIEIDIQHFSTIDQHTDFKVHQLSTFYLFSDTAMNFVDLYLEAGKSTIRKTIQLHYESLADMGDFLSKVDLYIDLDSTIVSTDDIALFAPAVKEFNDIYVATALIEGPVDNLEIKADHLTFGQNAVLQGEFSVNGLPDIDNTFLDFDFEQAAISYEDVENYAGESVEFLNKFGLIEFEGRFTGLYNDFVADAFIHNQFGAVDADIRLNLKDGANTYAGKLNTYGLDLGAIIDQQNTFGKLWMSGEIKDGRGFSLETARASFDGKISKFRVLGYTYSDISLDASISQELFKGDLQIKDPNIFLALNGTIDFSSSKPLVDIELDANNINFEALKLIDTSLSLTAQMDINIQGLKPDEIKGSGVIRNTDLRYGERNLYVGNLVLKSIIDSNYRQINLQTPYVDANIEGNFSYKGITQHFAALAKEIELIIKGDSIGSEKYYASLEAAPSFNADMLLDLKNLNPVLQLIDTSLAISKEEKLHAYLEGGNNSILQFDSEINFLKFGNSTIEDLVIDGTATKSAKNENLIADLNITSGKQNFSEAVLTDSLKIGVKWKNDDIHTDLFIQQQASDNHIFLSTNLSFQDSIYLNVDSSNVKILGEEWKVNNKANLQYKDSLLYISNFELKNGNQKVDIVGNIGQRPQDSLTILIQNFELAVFGPFIDEDVRGEMQSNVTIAAVLGDPRITGNIVIDSLVFSDIFLGDFHATASLDQKIMAVELDADLIRETKAVLSKARNIESTLIDTVLDIQGFYYTQREENQLDFQAILHRTNLVLADPFLKGFVSDIGGYAFGNVKITGNPSSPRLEGFVYTKDGKFTLDYTNTYYTFNDTIFLRPNGVFFQDFILEDIDGNTARFGKGGITHNNWEEIKVNISAQLNKFQALNTTKEDNSLFYGNAAVSGNLAVNGPIGDLMISANLSNERNTIINIPLSGEEEVTTSENITFVQWTDSTIMAADTIEADTVGRVDLQGIRISFDLAVNNEAEIVLIFDESAGDIARVQGSGNLDLEIDTRGDFNMFGRYEIQRGEYTFTFRNIIKKDFTVAPGSAITWSGDPANGRLDMTAIYTQQVNYRNWVPNVDSSNTQLTADLSRKYPIKVEMLLQGPLLNPDISFDIDPQLNTLPASIREPVANAERTFERDQQAENQQVFSILLLNSIMPIQTLAFTTSGDLDNSISELLSNELSSILNKYNENLEVNLNFGDFSANTLQLGFAYYLFDRRLRISRQGGVTGNTGTTTEEEGTNVAALAGDWTLEYLLTDEGNIRIKMFYRTTNSTSGSGNNLVSQNTTQQGVSLLHTESFNTFGELFSFLKSNKGEDLVEEIEPQQNPKNPKDSTLGPQSKSNPNSNGEGSEEKNESYSPEILPRKENEIFPVEED